MWAVLRETEGIGERLALLQTLAAAVDVAVSERPLWVNANGLGLPWLHVRLDTRPKYYWCRRDREAR